MDRHSPLLGRSQFAGDPAGLELHERDPVIMELKYLLNYFLTPWSRVLLEKLTSLQLVKKFPAFYGN